MKTKNRIEEFRVLLQQQSDAHYSTNFPNLRRPLITIAYGRKFAKVITDNYSQRSVYCFIDIKTGDILKSASWAAPAKGARGSIWNFNCDVGPESPCNTYGQGLYR